MMPGGGVQMVEAAHQPQQQQQDMMQMVMLPSGEQGLVVAGQGGEGILQDKHGVQYMVTSDGSDLVAQNGAAAEQAAACSQYDQQPVASNGHDSSMIRIVGIQDRRGQGGGSVVRSVGCPPAEPELARPAARPPRKQSLGPLSDISQQQQDPVALRAGVPPGLTGDLFKDTELVEAKVRRQ
jgi:hypothetical protein